MATFNDINISKQLKYGIDDLGFTEMTPIQEKSLPAILSGKDIIGLSNTGSGKTLAYMLPILQELKYSTQLHPRVLILVPTRDLVVQVVENIKEYTKYVNVRILGIHGDANIQSQAQLVAQGSDIIVATPGRIYDMAVARYINFKSIKKLVLDEVDILLDLGFIFQLTNILELLPERRQNILFSATMNEEVDEMIHAFFQEPIKIHVANSASPNANINQTCYFVPNYFTKVNLLSHLLEDKTLFAKVIIFVSTKKGADELITILEDTDVGPNCRVLHSNKSVNHRTQVIEDFDNGKVRILVATDIMARGLDFEKVTHVINFDTPAFPENYVHRIGRTGRASHLGNAILLYTEKEESYKIAIETLLDMHIEELSIPDDVEISHILKADEKPVNLIRVKKNRHELKKLEGGGAFHEKSEKNSKVNLGGSYRRELAAKYKKPQRRGDKLQNMRAKKRKK